MMISQQKLSYQFGTVVVLLHGALVTSETLIFLHQPFNRANWEMGGKKGHASPARICMSSGEPVSAW